MPNKIRVTKIPSLGNFDKLYPNWARKALVGCVFTVSLPTFLEDDKPWVSVNKADLISGLNAAGQGRRAVDWWDKNFPVEIFGLLYVHRDMCEFL